MFLIAYKNLIQEKVRLLVSITGVALSVLLILVLIGVYQGLSSKLGEYIATVPADLWVAQEGSQNLFDSTSILPATAQAQIEAVPGVNSVKTFNGRQTSIKLADKEKRAFVVGLGDKSGAPAPRVIDGTADIKPGEIILDRSIREASVGQNVTVGGKEFRVAGIIEGGNVLIVTYAFMTAADADALFRLSDTVNYFLVDTAGVDPGTVANGIRQSVPNTLVQNGPDFVENTTSIVKEVFLPIIGVLSLIGMAVGVTVVGLTIFTSTLEKAKEYGVLKAIGLSRRKIYGIVLQQAVIVSVAGFLVGAALGFGLTALAMALVPEFMADLRPRDLLIVFLATILMGAVAAVLPARRLNKIDPAEAFKA